MPGRPLDTSPVSPPRCASNAPRRREGVAPDDPGGDTRGVSFCTACGTALPEAARFCPACGAPAPNVAAPDVREERKLATVLFADLVGSTAQADAEDPERTRALLRRFYDAMAEEIDRSGGTLDKFMGDAAMAVFGVPVAREDHAERALHAAVAMRERLAALFGGTLSLRIGVNTGEMVAGEGRERGTFVTGDAINVAARLEQGAEPGEILVGERTAIAVGTAFAFGEPMSIAAKGKRDGIACRRLLRALASTRPRGAGALGRVFVGRERELGAIQEAYRAVATTGRAGLVALVGDAGMGKTTLLGELAQRFDAMRPRPRRHSGHCRSTERGTTYAPVGEVVREHLGLRPDDAADRVREALGRHEILGLTLGLPGPSGLHPLVVRDRLRRAWIEFAQERLAADGPAIVIVEDLHWAEDPLIDLLEAAAHEVRAPLLVIVTARPDAARMPEAPREGGAATTLRLDPLPAADVGRLIDRLTRSGLPLDLRELLLSRAEGNPFFIEELLRSLIDSGALVREADEWRARQERQELRLPDSVRAVLAARIDLLDPAVKTALLAAAVIGRIFWAGLVRELVPGGAPDLGTLEERGFIRHRRESSLVDEQEFEFGHAQIREVAYASLPKADRAHIHARAAAWLEDLEAVAEERAGLLAHHYAEAVRPEDVDLAWAGREESLQELRACAVAWSLTAARQAVGRYEIDGARGLYARAAEIETRREALVGIWREIGHVAAISFDASGFSDAMERAIALAQEGPELADLHSDLAYQTLIRAGMWSQPPDGALVSEWVENALAVVAPHGAARAKALIARCYSDYDKSPEMVAEATEIAERLADATLLSHCDDLRGLIALAEGDHAQALEWSRRRVARANQIEDPDHGADIHATAVVAAAAAGRFQEAREYAIAHDEITAELSPHHRLHGVSTLLELEELKGNWDAARRLRDRVEEAVQRNLGTPCLRNQRSLVVLALAHAHMGDETEARRLEVAAREFTMTGFGTAQDTPWMRLALLRGDLDTVETLLGDPGIRRTNWFYVSSVAGYLDGLAATEQEERLEQVAAPLLVRPGGYLEPFALRALGKVRADSALVARAVERFDALGLSWHAEQTRTGG